MTTPDGRDATKRLDEALARLPLAVDPAQDLWPAIEARLDERERATGRRWAWQAAAGVLLVVGSSLLTATLLQRDGTKVASAPAAPATTLETLPVAIGAAYAPDPEYVAARRALADMLASRVDALPPSARQKLEANLAEIRRATAEINAALALQPGDPLLEELLLNAYQDELAVLASVNDLTGV